MRRIYDWLGRRLAIFVGRPAPTGCNNYVLVAGPVPLNVSPYGFMVWARHFRKCRHDFQSPDPLSPVPHFLICRAIELGLKARLLETRTQKVVKDKFRHNLIKCLRALPVGEVTLTDEQRRVLKAASTIYDKQKGFEYWSVIHAINGFKQFPDISVLDAIADIVITDAT